MRVRNQRRYLLRIIRSKGHRTNYLRHYRQHKVARSDIQTMGFTKMLIDEAHLYPRESDSMLGKFLEESGITHVLGITATPVKLQTNRDLDGNTFSKLVMLTSRSKKGNFFKDIIHVGRFGKW